ncbi:MAG: ferritin-like domain-containing protein [bacterium]|nr:ferritin-like domain-containing protein [bacterium]
MTAGRSHCPGQMPGVLLAVLIDSINQSFFHSRMLRAWGHSKAMESNDHWMQQMRQASSLVEAMTACGIRLDDKPASDLVIGCDSMTVLAADAAQAERCAATASDVARTLPSGALRSLMNEIAASEEAHAARLRAWCEEPSEGTRHAKHLLPKPGARPLALEALNRALRPLVAAVSQIFLYSLVFGCGGRKEAAKRELVAALEAMARAEALLERLLDLGGLPDHRRHGRLSMGSGPDAAGRTALDVHDVIIAELEAGLATLDAIADPLTHTLIDGILRAERAARRDVAQRLTSPS